jgi:hypothetical protein
VVIDEPRHFGQLREKLSIVTSAWFAQRYGDVIPGEDGKSASIRTFGLTGLVISRDFSDVDILKVRGDSLRK